MELQHTFTVPAPIDRAWSTLLDVERIAPCFPGAALTGVDGEEFSGTVKVKLGPVSLQYAGKGRFVDRDEASRRVLLEANGTDKRGNGTAAATVSATLRPDGEDATRVVVDTDLTVTGRPAQFGRGVLQDVGTKIIDQFATCLASRMAEGAAAPATRSALENDPALARLEELGEPERRLGLPETAESPAALGEERGAASTSSRAGSGRTRRSAAARSPVTAAVSATQTSATPVSATSATETPATGASATGASATGTSATEHDPALARLQELGEPERRLGLPETGESPAATGEERGAASTSSVAGSGRTAPVATAADAGRSADVGSAGPGPTSTSTAESAGELDLGAVLLPALARRYGPALLAGLVAVLVVWLIRRRGR